MELTKVDKLFAAKALLKALEKEVKILESECKDELREQYMEDGKTTQNRSRYFGTKAGCLSLTPGKEPQRKVMEFVANQKDVDEWMNGLHEDVFFGYALDNVEDFCKWCFAQTGEVIPGFERIEYMSDPGMPTVKLTVRENVVLPMLMESGMLEGSVRYLLGDGE